MCLRFTLSFSSIRLAFDFHWGKKSVSFHSCIFRLFLDFLFQEITCCNKASCHGYYLKKRHTRNQYQDHHGKAGNHDCPRLLCKLLRNILIQGAFRNGSRYNHTGGYGDEKRRNLSHKSVSHRCNGIGGKHGCYRLPGLDDADDTSSNQIDCRCDERHDTVSLYNLGRTVHGTVEIRFHLNLLSSLSGLFFRDHPGGKIRINRHLLTGHRIQLKACRHFRHTLCALCDNNKLHKDNYQINN